MFSENENNINKNQEPKSMVFQREFNITGKVQGVYFRSFCSNIAYPLEIYGYAKNKPDDSVTLLIQAEKLSILDEFLLDLNEELAKQSEIKVSGMELLIEAETDDVFEDFRQLYPDQYPHETLDDFMDRIDPPGLLEVLRRKLRGE